MIQEIWKSRNCPIEYAIYLGDNRYYPLIGEVPSTKVGDIKPLPLDENFPNEALASLDESFSSSLDEYTIFGGGTSWEGDGFLALEDKFTNKLFWLFHFTQSEAFVNAEIERGIVIANSEEYPRRFIFKIPIRNPIEFDINTLKCT